MVKTHEVDVYGGCVCLQSKQIGEKNKHTLANNLDTMQPRFRILHCLEYGKYGITPTIDLAEEVLQA